MPLKLNVGASKKVGESNFGSRGASINVEMELDSALVGDPARLQERIRQLFGLVRASLAEELNGNGSHTASNGPAPDRGHDSRNGSNGNGSSRQGSPPRPATPSQVKAIYAIARAQRLNINQLVRDRFQVEKPDDLSIQEASQLIDSLKSSRPESS